MSEFDNQPWIADVRARLEDSAQSLDAATVSRLNRARQAALARHRSRRHLVWWLPAAGLAFSCALLLAVAFWPQDGNAPAGAALPVVAAAGDDAADAIAADDNIDFYQDLEFYAWLDAEDLESDG
jgi:hypothetical protein